MTNATINADTIRRLADLGITVIGSTDTHIGCADEHGSGWERIEHVERALDAADAIIGASRDAQMDRRMAFHRHTQFAPYHMAIRPTMPEFLAEIFAD